MFRKSFVNFVCYLLLIIFLLVSFPLYPASAKPKRVKTSKISFEGIPTHEYDVVVVGAGLSGVSAAISAARLGMRVLVVEDSDVVGGQAAASAVSTMDDMGKTRCGIYKEFLNRASAYYAASNTAVGICLWGGNTFAFEPKIIDKTLRDMMTETGKITLLSGTQVLSAQVIKDKLASIVIAKDGVHRQINAKVFIDATETGDFISLTGARYRVGNGIFPNINDTSIIQDITYVAVVKKYREGLPEEFFLKTKPPHYDEYVKEFRAKVTEKGSGESGQLPFDVLQHNAYRALPDEESPFRDKIRGGNRATWQYISHTGINMANDWPGNTTNQNNNSVDAPGLSVRYLTDAAYRLETNRSAMIKTLCFIYYMQHELGCDSWGIDNTQNFGRNVSCDLEHWHSLPKEFLPTVRFFPPKPYVRESKRIVGVETMSSKDVRRDPQFKRVLFYNKGAVAVGEYPADLHGNWDVTKLEEDLLDKEEDFGGVSSWEAKLFQIPMKALIPEKINGLLAAEKNISASRLVNGAIRLHPVAFHTGQAAGTLAAIAIKQGKEPRDVNPLFVQSTLLDNGCGLSVHQFKDIFPESKHWKEINIALLYEYMLNHSEKAFYCNKPVMWSTFLITVDSLAGKKFASFITDVSLETTTPITKAEVNQFFAQHKKDSKNFKYFIPFNVGEAESELTREELACIVYNIVMNDALEKEGQAKGKK